MNAVLDPAVDLLAQEKVQVDEIQVVFVGQLLGEGVGANDVHAERVFEKVHFRNEEGAAGRTGNGRRRGPHDQSAEGSDPRGKPIEESTQVIFVFLDAIRSVSGHVPERAVDDQQVRFSLSFSHRLEDALHVRVVSARDKFVLDFETDRLVEPLLSVRDAVVHAPLATAFDQRVALTRVLAFILGVAGRQELGILEQGDGIFVDGPKIAVAQDDDVLLRQQALRFAAFENIPHDDASTLRFGYRLKTTQTP